MKKILILSCWIFFGNSMGADVNQPRSVHNKQQFNNQVYNDDYLRIVLKFHDGSGVRSNKHGDLIIKPGLQNLNTLKQRRLSTRQINRDVLAINRYLDRLKLKSNQLIKGLESDFKNEKEKAEQFWQKEMAEIPTYQQLLLKDGGQDPKLALWVRTLNTYSSLEIAYAEPIAMPPINQELATPPIPWQSCNAVPIDPAVGDLSGLQGYLGAPPTGINADLLNQIPGGQGSGIRVIDVEGGYYPHSDHRPLFQNVGNTTQYGTSHGNAVIGIIGAQHNGIGLNGLSPDANIGIRSIFNHNLFDDLSSAGNSSANVAHHLYWAARHSMQGVVLIELHRNSTEEPDCTCNFNGVVPCRWTPVEYWPAEFDTIQNATGNGVIFVEAAGNGSRSLDSTMFNTCTVGHCFDRSVRDSGAILVSGSRADGLTPFCGFPGRPNYGSRIDVHSWGELIPNTTFIGSFLYDGNSYCNDYSDNFAGTSGASAIIAGAVTALQGAYLAKTGNRLDALSMREALRVTGTPQTPTNVDGNDILIGPHPNLTAALQYALDNF